MRLHEKFVPVAGTQWKRLADYVRARRVALGYQTRTAFAEAVPGVSDRTIAQLELGHSVRDNTLAAVEIALKWKPGSARAVLAGGDPSPEQEGSPGVTYADPALQQIWELPLEESIRRALIGLAVAMRENNPPFREKREA